MKGNKYGVSAKSERTLNGILYASKKEMKFRQTLELLKSAKNDSERVVSIEEQVTYKFIVNEVLVCSYRLDFKVIYADGRIEHVDCKGYRKGVAYTMFQYKQRLMKALFSIDVLEV